MKDINYTVYSKKIDGKVIKISDISNSKEIVLEGIIINKDTFDFDYGIIIMAVLKDLSGEINIMIIDHEDELSLKEKIIINNKYRISGYLNDNEDLLVENIIEIN